MVGAFIACAFGLLFAVGCDLFDTDLIGGAGELALGTAAFMFFEL